MRIYQLFSTLLACGIGFLISINSYSENSVLTQPIAEAEQSQNTVKNSTYLNEINDEDIMAISDELKAILDLNVRPIKRIEAKTIRLHEILFGSNYYNIRYAFDDTRIANDVFEARTGNCISLAALYVASARYVGLDAYFQSVDIEQTWEKRDGHYVVPGHVNARIAHPSKTIVVEFISTYFLETLSQKKSRKISDKRVFAEFYNNLGMEAFDAGHLERAETLLAKAVSKDKKLDFAWSNLGVIYKHQGKLDQAEKAYLKAQKLNKRNPTFANNLYVLYRETDQHKKAEALAKRVIKYNRKNPYYLAQLAQTDMATKHYDSAVEHLLNAIKIKPEEEQFYVELSKSYYYKGDLEGTKKALIGAATAANMPENQARYNHKVKLIEQYVNEAQLNTSRQAQF